LAGPLFSPFLLLFHYTICSKHQLSRMASS